MILYSLMINIISILHYHFKSKNGTSIDQHCSTNFLVSRLKNIGNLVHYIVLVYYKRVVGRQLCRYYTGFKK